ncbi:PREDICTED: uncharacterized protein LOC108780196 [Cyphomyrmex costatus]|uniref:Peptidase aspartic putative domain-containing protein n=1 Tax=Cyphomyrmex costatus TaxID=456900 RepID=A0A151I9E1_9HYME|nr:PREDICTED: uncharacterized protein LOC108780196 [Cyphomyrmex costatus]KYM95563.1 hypothetical protein ALC62_13787 [Cyphomyrmex costatus]
MCQAHSEVIEEESYIKHRIYERCQEFYVHAKAVLLEQRETIETSNPSSCLSDALVPEIRVSSRRNLPKISLPAFSGDYHAWRSFHDLFASMVGENDDLTNVEKMHYLKTCLKGDAARLVINLKVTENTFSIAWKNLVSRYENKRVLISAQLDRLLSLKPIKSKSAQELNTMIATVTESLGALEALNCLTSAWDPLLVHQLSRLLDEDTREAWEVKLGPSTSYPTLKEFEEFVIGHTRAWESLGSSIKPVKDKGRSSWPTNKSDTKSRSMIATAPTTKGGVECRLCKSAHYLFNCPTYLSQPLERRKRTVLKLNLCFNCLGSHAANRCPSSRRCRKCSYKHHTTLHDDRKSHLKSVNKTDSDTSTINAPSSSASNSEQK